MTEQTIESVREELEKNINIYDKKIKTIFISEGKKFSKSGGYIPSS